jgi:tRNA-2-methylthio-N6-dimethylallyladenosine synthase
MRRSYRQGASWASSTVRAAMPDAAITTDIIVGFPGETEEDFLKPRWTSCARPGSRQAFTFQYSKRPGTPAADDARPGAAEVVKDRYQRLVALVDEIAWEENQKLVGARVELLVAEGEGRKDAATARLSGRAPTTGSCTSIRMGADGVRPGDMVTVEITVRRTAPPRGRRPGAVLASYEVGRCGSGVRLSRCRLASGSACRPGVPVPWDRRVRQPWSCSLKPKVR